MRKIFIFNKGYNVRATVEVEYMTEGEEKRLSICGTLYAPNIRCGGQCLDHIAQYIDDESSKLSIVFGSCITSTICTPSVNIKRSFAGFN